MPSETVLKVLVALNAVQMFITLLLVATMASAGITARSEAHVASKASGRPLGAVDTFAGGVDRPAAGGQEPGPGGDPGDGGEPPPSGPDTEADRPPAPAIADAPPKAEDAGRAQIIMRTYLNLVSRRLQLASTDAGVDATAWIPGPEEIDAAVASGDAGSAAFTAALEKLKPGYEKLNMDFPAPPASRSEGR